MAAKVAVIVVYFVIVLIIGSAARTRRDSSPEDYFLAGRTLGTPILLCTMLATNFSAFTVFGASGAGYRDGYAFFPIMGFGTGFMALTFWMLGRRIWQVSRLRRLITPPEMIRELYGSPLLSALFALVMVIFTVPYLALQPMAAGYSLEALVGLPYFSGCVLVTAVIVFYTLRGGMRAVAWTDAFQGGVMFILLLLSLVLVVRHHGGFITANQKVLALHPELFSRPGGQGGFTVGVWFSYMMLWFFCDPMFPQIFQRFFTARSSMTITRVMLFYPLVCSAVFILPVSIGVLGRLSFPDLAGAEADKILPMVLTGISGDVMAATVMAAGLAALMSTMDSQLLTLGSIFTRDIFPAAGRGKKGGALAGRLFIVALALAGLALAYRPPATILQIATQTFTGLAVLFPTVFFGLYLKRVFPLPALLSIICGEAAVAAFHFDWISPGEFLPVVWVMVIAFGIYVLAHLAILLREGSTRPFFSRRPVSPYLIPFGLIFFLGIDFWAWKQVSPFWLSIPVWVWYFVLLSAVQTLFILRMVRKGPRSPAPHDDL